MKKKMIALVALVLAVVVTGYSVSGTYAKYATDLGEVSDYARVAKWGIKKGEGDFSAEIDLFKTTYNSNTIKSNDENNLVAPGAKGSYEFKFDNTSFAPEVAYKLTADVTVTDKTKQLKFALVNSESKMITKEGSEGGQFTDVVGSYTLSASDLEAALIKILLGDNEATKEKNYKEFDVGSKPSSKGTYTIYWMWDFDNETTKDTNLGNGLDDAGGENNYTTNVAGGSESSAPVYVKVHLSAEQIKEKSA